MVLNCASKMTSLSLEKRSLLFKRLHELCPAYQIQITFETQLVYKSPDLLTFGTTAYQQHTKARSLV